MNITIWPKSKVGKWAAILGIAYIVLMWLKLQFHLPVFSFAIAGVGLVGFVLSLIAVLKNKDRALIILLPLLAGIVLVIWIVAEILYPH